jgi:hypothetical protein
MTDWKRLAKAVITAKGLITAEDAAIFKREILADGRVSREEAEFLLDLKSSVAATAPEFNQFLYDFIKKVVLLDGAITGNEVAWLKTVLFRDGSVDVLEQRLLKELKDAVLVSCPAFDDLWAQYQSV